MAVARSQRRRVITRWVVVALVASTVLPVWELWYVGSWEASVELCPLWRVLWEVAWPDPPPGVWPKMRGGYATGGAITTVVVGIAGVLSFAFAGRHKREAEQPSRPSDLNKNEHPDTV
jgi:hypothetical protein